MHVEWADASHGPTLVGPGEFRHGGSAVDDHAILVGSDSTMVIEGSLDELDQFASQIKALVAARRTYPYAMNRSCFMDFPTAAAAKKAVAALGKAEVVEHTVNNTMRHKGPPACWSVYFTLNCDGGSLEEDAFIEAATKLGGTYSGS